MSSSDTAISIRGLSKAYTISHNGSQHVTLAETILHKIRHPFTRTTDETFNALTDVSFDIKKGDVVGIIGRNGAGKSTLLKILSRITEPTTGEIDVYGRIGSLLEVGTGFHPELTGRENIFLNGAILGMRKSEITRQFDAIVDFSGVEKFLDTPVKRYSSGMYVRLAFAVAAHLSSEILIVDEVLAVGDAEFQRKCLGKMKDVATGGRTVLFVSHNMAAVQNLCSRALLLRRGQLQVDGSVDEVTEAYLSQMIPADSGIDLASASRSVTGPIKCVGMRILRNGAHTAAVSPSSPFTIEIDVQVDSPTTGVTASIDVDAASGERVTTLYSGFAGASFELHPGRTTLTCNVHGLDLRPDDYVLNVMLGHDHGQYDFVRSAAILTVAADDFYGSGRLPSRGHGPLLSRFEWFHGAGDAIQPAAPRLATAG